MPRAADDRITAEALGARLRAARIARGSSLRSVATALGVSPSLISLVENGKTRPSVSTLTALVDHLGITFDDLLAAPPAVARQPSARPGGALFLQRRGSGPVVESANGVRWERLSTLGEGGVDPYLVTYPPGASNVPGPPQTAGFEYAYLISGELTVHLGEETAVLHAGDALNVAAARPHSYSNDGAVPARGLWFLVTSLPQ